MHNGIRRSAALGIVALSVPATAAADHTLPPVPRGALPFDGTSVAHVRIDATATASYIDNRTSTLWTVGLDGAVRVGRRFGIRFRVPLHRIDYDDGSASQQGIGDVVAGGYSALRLSRKLRTTLGIDLLLPTGDRRRGLGQDAMAVAPMAQLTRSLSPRHNLYAGVSAIANLTTPDDQSDSVLAERRAGAEFRCAIGATYLRQRWRAAGELRLQVPLGEDPAAGDAYATAATTVDLRVTPHIWSAAFLEVPLQPMRRIDWRSGIALSYVFE